MEVNKPTTEVQYRCEYTLERSNTIVNTPFIELRSYFRSLHGVVVKLLALFGEFDPGLLESWMRKPIPSPYDLSCW